MSRVRTENRFPIDDVMAIAKLGRDGPLTLQARRPAKFGTIAPNAMLDADYAEVLPPAALK
jgi:hypothetical protein